MSGRSHTVWTPANAVLPAVWIMTSMVVGSPSATRADGFVGLPLPPEPEALAIVAEALPRGRTAFIATITREAQRHGLPTALADAVVHVESGYDPGAFGAVGEIGLMQVRPATAAMMGHLGSASDLFVPETNIRLGVAYLAGAWRLARGDLCTALAKYRAGHGQRRVTPRSTAYCMRVRTYLASMGSSLAGGERATPPAAGLIETSAPSRFRSESSTWRRGGHASSVRRLWAEHAERVRRIDLRIARVITGG